MTPTALDLRPLALLALAVSALALADVVPTWPGLAHHVALPPLDLFADVRVLAAEADSYPAFVGGLAVAIGVRALVLAAMLRALDVRGVGWALGFYALALPVALVAGALAYSGVAAVYSTFLWIGTAVAVVTAVVAGPRPWCRGRPWSPGARQVAASLPVLLVLSLLSALGSDAVRVALVPASAVLTGATAWWLRRPRPTGPRRAVAAPGLATAIALLALAGGAPRAAPEQASAPGSLFVVPGIGGASGTTTMFQLDPTALGFDCADTTYFSYAGAGAGAPQRDAWCPILSGAPYVAEDTRRPLAELVPSFREQFAALEPPVVVVAHSQGGWVAGAALDGLAPAPAAVVLLGAFPGHRSAYRLDGTGDGVVGTDALELLTGLLRRLELTTFHPRAPLASELLGTPGAIPEALDGLDDAGRVVTVTSSYDLPTMVGDGSLPGAVDLCPTYVAHGALPTSNQVLEEVRRVLDGETDGRCRGARRWPTLAFSAFGVPTG